MTAVSPVNTSPIGTVISDQDTPTFEVVRVKLKTGQEVKPGTLIRIPVAKDENSVLIGRVRSAHELNPNESPEDINVRETLGLAPNYPGEEDSTTIYRLVEADLVEEIVGDKLRSPQTLPNSGAEVFVANEEEIIQTLGLVRDESIGLNIGETTGGTSTQIILKREAIQRHFFICGTTGSGKSYAMGVITEELVRHKVPVIFVDTQDEYSVLVSKLGGQVLVPGKDFNIRISSLTDRELLDLVPTDSELHKNIITASFLELQDEIKDGTRTKFMLQDLLDKINIIGPTLTNKADSVNLAYRRAKFLERIEIFGEGVERANWPKLMSPCLAIKCKHLTSSRLQTVATALLRELQDLRLRDFIPPYVAVVDEAHLFVPEGEGSPCKQIIREGVRIGRHHGICLVLLTQSPVDIDKRAIRQCNTRLVFALEPDQLEAIRGVKADASEEMLRALPKMPRGTCLLSGTYESVKHTIPVSIRTRKTKDSEGGKTPDIFKQMKEKWIPKIGKRTA
ncbi:MAG: ATP-binding protein [Thermoproteota archaeon]|nr:ATP-binding protein [Acidobacteriota bacterium]MDQ3903553.1 ATP-binding protein [Thermoproteota archaeon]